MWLPLRYIFVNKISIVVVGSMVAILYLSPLFCKFDNLILKLHPQKISYFDEQWLFVDMIKVGSVLGMGNKFTYKLAWWT